MLLFKSFKKFLQSLAFYVKNKKVIFDLRRFEQIQHYVGVKVKKLLKFN